MAITFGWKAVINGITLGASAPILDSIDVSQRIKDNDWTPKGNKALKQAEQNIQNAIDAKIADEKNRASIMDALIGNGSSAASGTTTVPAATTTGTAFNNTDIIVVVALAVAALIAILFMRKGSS